MGTYIVMVIGVSVVVSAGLLRQHLFQLKRRQGIEPSIPIIAMHSDFYRRLPSHLREFYLDRVANFFHEKNFVGRNGMVIDHEIKILIAAHAVQITFGFPKVALSHFKTVIVFPEEYRSPVTGVLHKGEVHSSGAIVVSWSHAVQGYIDSDDGLNLLLHEMTHALEIENRVQNHEWDFINRQALARLEQERRNHLPLIRSGKSILREYAATNASEFFAVCVENFFERPYLFKAEHPELYNAVARVLNQENYPWEDQLPS